MGKIINLSAVLEKEEKLQQVVDYMEELKDRFSDLIQEYEDDGADVRKVDTPVSYTHLTLPTKA
mgnify:CR=1 FL=1